MTYSIDNGKPEKPDAPKANRNWRQIAFCRKVEFFRRFWPASDYESITALKFRIVAVLYEVSLLIGTQCD